MKNFWQRDQPSLLLMVSYSPRRIAIILTQSSFISMKLLTWPFLISVDVFYLKMNQTNVLFVITKWIDWWTSNMISIYWKGSFILIWKRSKEKISYCFDIHKQETKIVRIVLVHKEVRKQVEKTVFSLEIKLYKSR